MTESARRNAARLLAAISVSVELLVGCTSGSPAGAEPSAVPIDEQMAALAGCMGNHGFPVELRTFDAEGVGGLADGRVPPEQRDLRREALSECRDQLGMSATGPPPTKEELAARYQEALDVYECLVEHGLQSTEPRSLDVYIDSMGRWLPVQSGLDTDVLRESFEKCPNLNKFLIVATEDE